MIAIYCALYPIDGTLADNALVDTVHFVIMR